jgi:hypothetical protein
MARPQRRRRLNTFLSSTPLNRPLDKPHELWIFELLGFLPNSAGEGAHLNFVASFF